MSILTLAEARTALSFDDDDTSRDDLLNRLCAGVDDAVEGHLDDWVVWREVDVEVPKTGLLPGRNVAAVLTAEYLDGSGSIDTTGMRVTRSGLIVGPSGLPLKPWTVKLQVGLDPIPEAIKHGAGEILTQAYAAWRSDSPGAFLVSYRAAAWLDSHTLMGGGTFA